MDYLLSLLNRVVGDEELARLLFVGAIGLSAVLAMVTLAMLVSGLRDPVMGPGVAIDTAHIDERAKQ
jgi:tight adherence protein C